MGTVCGMASSPYDARAIFWDVLYRGQSYVGLACFIGKCFILFMSTYVYNTVISAAKSSMLINILLSVS